MYVIAIDPEANRVVVGGGNELETSEADVSSLVGAKYEKLPG